MRDREALSLVAYAPPFDTCQKVISFINDYSVQLSELTDNRQIPHLTNLLTLNRRMSCCNENKAGSGFFRSLLLENFI